MPSPASWSGGPGPIDLVLVHSVPSGVIGLSRYLDAGSAAGSRGSSRSGCGGCPRTSSACSRAARRVALVQVHHLGQASPAEPWLREHARLVAHRVYDGERGLRSPPTSARCPRLLLDALHQDQLVEVFYFEPTDGATFFSGPPVDPRARCRCWRRAVATGPAPRSTTGAA